MSIQLPIEARHARQTIVRAVRGLKLGWNALLSSGGDSAQLSTALPHVLYTVGLDSIARGRLLKEATAKTLRYVVEDNSNAVALAETSLPNERGRVTLIGFDSQRAAAMLVSALADVESDKKLASIKFELRALHVPALYLSALWLHSSRRDVVIPYGKTAKPVVEGARYTDAELLRLLQPLAKRRLSSELKLFGKRP